MKFNRMTRRHFLRSGSATLILPFLPSLLPEKVLAQTLTQKNFIGIAAFNGLYRMYGPTSILMPPTSPSGGTLPGFGSMDLVGKHRIHFRALTDIKNQNGRISEIINASFNPYLNKMQLLQGLDYLALGWRHHHGNFGNMASSFSGSNGMPNMATIDQVMSYSSHTSARPGFYKNPNLIGKSVAYNANTSEQGNYGASYSFNNPNDRYNSAINYKSPYSNPLTLWNAFFGNSTPATPTNLKKTIVDQVFADYQSLRSNSRLGSEDKKRLDLHINMLQETQRKAANVGAICSALKPASSLTDRKLILRTMNDVIVSLISCGLCHTFLGWANSIASSNPEDWHNWSHAGYDGENDQIADASAYNNLVEHNRSVMHDMFLDLVSKLEQADQLDNSLVVCIQEHSNRGHQAWNVPVIMAGSAGGVLRTDQYIDYRNLAARNDTTHTRFGFPVTQLLANILRAVDVQPSEYEAYNKDGFSQSLFVNKSGYGHSKFDPEAVNDFGSHYRSGWQNHDLSDWLPKLLG